MPLKKINLENFTVFEKLDIEFCDGINVFIGNNGTGKTHVLKLLYAACQAARAKTTAVDFPQKIVKVFRPDDFNILRLVRRKASVLVSKVSVASGAGALKVLFDRKTKRWDAEVTGMQAWEKQYENLTSTFIPAKEILSNSRNLIQAIDKGNVDFDDTYKDIISAASVDISRGPDNERRKKYLARLQAITQGRVKFENEEFYLLPTGQSQSRLEFQLVAEGLRKIALLWQLIKNGTLENGSVLFWDEPEANINPQNIPAIVDLLLDLQEDGVQIFISTHDYVLAKYFEIKTRAANQIRFHSFYKEEDTVNVSSAGSFKNLSVNVIEEAYNKLLDEVFEGIKEGN